MSFETFQMETDAANLNKTNNLESYFDRCKNGYVHPNGTDLQWSNCKEEITKESPRPPRFEKLLRLQPFSWIRPSSMLLLCC